MPNISVSRALIEADPSDAEEWNQYDQKSLQFQWQSDAGSPIDLSSETIKCTAEFVNADVTITSGENTSVNFANVTRHETLTNRALTVTKTAQNAVERIAYVTIPADIWPEEIAYGLTTNVPVVILHLHRETLNAGDLVSRDSTKHFLIIRPVAVAGG